jgi:type II secretory pathway component PulJ
VARDVEQPGIGARRAGLAGLRSRAGVTLVELLVAACITSVALAGAWAWLWTAGGASRGAAGRAQAASAAAFAVRSLAEDLGMATSLACPPAGLSPDRALCIEHRHEGVPAETVLVVWDPARRVLWHKAPGTYLADHVERFAVGYFGADGRCLGAADFAAPDWPQTVARVAVTLEVTVGRSTVRAARSVALMPRAT